MQDRQIRPDSLPRLFLRPILNVDTELKHVKQKKLPERKSDVWKGGDGTGQLRSVMVQMTAYRADLLKVSKSLTRTTTDSKPVITYADSASDIIKSNIGIYSMGIKFAKSFLAFTICDSFSSASPSADSKPDEADGRQLRG